MRRLRLLTTGVLVASQVVMWLAGCQVGPDYTRPETAAETASGFAHGGAHRQDVNEPNALNAWWEGFGDPVTVQLVRRALENNNDLKASAARVVQAHALLVEARSYQWPDVAYGASRDRSKMSFNLGGGGEPMVDPNTGIDFGELFGGRFSPLTTTWSQRISVSYLVDFFGKLRRSSQAAFAEVLAAEFGQQALTNSIIATVVGSRINIATTQSRLAIARANTRSRERTLEIVERRYNEGLVGPLDVRLARANLEASRAQEPGIELSLATAHHALDVLVGRQPATGAYLPKTLGELPDLDPVPIGVPAYLLDRRPDVRAAEFSLRAANERIGISLAGQYPDLMLTASYGTAADEFADMWDSDFEVYSAIVNLTAPIWNAGRIRAQIKAAEARFAELAVNYSQTVLTAIREVEDALITETKLQEQYEHASLQLEEARAGEELSQQRYERGVDSILTVLESQRQRRLSEEQLTILKGQIWATRVNLHLALGGDWQRAAESSVDQEVTGK